MNTCLGKIIRQRINIFNKNYILNKEDIESDISISGKIEHTSHHLFYIINQLKGKLNLIMFMDEKILQEYLKTLKDSERRSISIRNLSSDSRLLTNYTLDKNNTIIFLMDKPYQNIELLEKIHNIYNLIPIKHLKIVIINNNINIGRAIYINIEKYKKINHSKNISLFCLSNELKHSLKTNINIIHAHYDPNYSEVKFRNLFQDKYSHIIRNIKTLSNEDFFIIKNIGAELHFCKYNYVQNNECINIKDYFNNEISIKLRYF